MTLCYRTNRERHLTDMLHLHISPLYANKQAKRKKTLIHTTQQLQAFHNLALYSFGLHPAFFLNHLLKC